MRARARPGAFTFPAGDRQQAGRAGRNADSSARAARLDFLAGEVALELGLEAGHQGRLGAPAVPLDEVLAGAARRSPALEEWRSLPSLPASPGVCWIVLVPKRPLPRLRPALLLPLRWRAGAADAAR